MNVTNMKISELKEYESNPRLISNEAVDKVAESIKEFGFKVPIIIDENNVIVAGHTRKLAAESIGMEEVPVTVADDLTEDQIKAFRLADNKVSEFSEWDFEKLEEEINSIENEFTGFSAEDIKKMFDDDEEEESFDDVGDDLEKTMEVIIECDDEKTQQELYERLTEEGYTCRVLTL